MPPRARQQEALGLGQMRRRGQSAQRLDAGHEAAHLGIGGDQAFGVQFAEGDVEGPLIRTELPETVQGQISMHSPMRMPVARVSRRALAGRSSVRRSSCCKAEPEKNLDKPFVLGYVSSG